MRQLIYKEDVLPEEGSTVFKFTNSFGAEAQHRLTRTYQNANKAILKAERDLPLREIFERDITDYINITGNTKSANMLRDWHATNSSWYNVG